VSVQSSTYTRVHRISRSNGHNKLHSPSLSFTHTPHTGTELFTEMPQPHIGPMPYEQAPPSHYQAPQQYTGSPNFHTPVQPPAPKLKPDHSGPRIFHYSKCTGKKRAVCVSVLGDSRSYSYIKIDAGERHVRLGRNQLHGDGQGIERLCKRCQERPQVPHECVRWLPHILRFRPHDPLHRKLGFQTGGHCGLDRRYSGF